MDIKARQTETTPATWDAGEMVFVDGGDGTAAMYVTSASGVPRRIVSPAPTAPVPTSVTRTGAVTPRALLDNITYIQQFVTPSTNVPLTGLILEQATAQGATSLMILDQTTSTMIATAPLTQVGADLRAALNVTLIAGRSYRLSFGRVGSDTGQLASVVISQGHAWTGVTPAHQVAYYDAYFATLDGDTDPPLPQLPLQYVTGDMSGADASGITHRADAPAEVSYDPQTRTYTHRVGLGNVTNDAQVKRSEMGVASGVATLGADGKVPSAQLPSVGGVTSVAGRTGVVTLTSADLVDFAEGVQDTVAAMLGGAGTYNDAAGTYTITFPQARTDEEIQDVVAALIQVGGSVTKTYDDAGNVLTLSVTGGGSASGVFRGAWTASTAYARNDIVLHGGVMYYAPDAFTSGAAFNAANWSAWPGGATGYTSSNPVPLAVSGTADFLPTDRAVEPTAGNYRMVGPVVTAPAGTALTYTSVKVPLRNLTAGSAHIGKTAYLLQVRVESGLVVSKLTLPLTQGLTELVYNGPFTVPAGQGHAFVVGVSGGAWNDDTAVYYGATSAFAAPNNNVQNARTDTDPSGAVAGGTFSMNVGAAHRTVLLYGNNVPKGTVGPAFTVGPTPARPTAPGVQAGDQHYDTTLSKPVWWSGSSWKDAAGTTV